MTDATPPTAPCMPIIHTQPGSSSSCPCHCSGSGVGLCWEGEQCPLSLLTLSPLGSGEGLCISKCLCGFHLWIRMWITPDGRWLCKPCEDKKKKEEKKSKRISVSLNEKQGNPKTDMLIMSEVRKSSDFILFFMPGGKSLQLLLCLTRLLSLYPPQKEKTFCSFSSILTQPS